MKENIVLNVLSEESVDKTVSVSMREELATEQFSWREWLPPPAPWLSSWWHRPPDSRRTLPAEGAAGAVSWGAPELDRAAPAACAPLRYLSASRPCFRPGWDSRTATLPASTLVVAGPLNITDVQILELHIPNSLNCRDYISLTQHKNRVWDRKLKLNML